MISGAHVVIYSKNAEADRAFLRDVLGFAHVDAGGGWLIFALPPAEVAVHPADQNGRHEIYLMCDDVEAVIGRLQAANVPTRPVTEEAWGLLTAFTLPGGGEVGIYQPKHPTAIEAAAQIR
jgi:catechol 2,3-dioxygenase-like lactoylglutathione lyase family enzyme